MQVVKPSIATQSAYMDGRPQTSPATTGRPQTSPLSPTASVPVSPSAKFGNLPADLVDTRTEEQRVVPFREQANIVREGLAKLEASYKSETEDLYKEIGELSDRLNAVLMSNWAFTQDRATMKPGQDTPNDVSFVPLHLVSDPKTVPGHGQQNSLTQLDENNIEPASPTGLPPMIGDRPETVWTVDPEARVKNFLEGAPQFAVLSSWTRAREQLAKEQQMQQADHHHHGHHHHHVGELGFDEEEEEGPALMLRPDSNPRLVWDIMTACLVCYDMIMIPMYAFNMEDAGFLVVMDWVTLLFWSCDMFASFFTGYVKDGTTIMSYPKVAANYMKVWFWIDIAVVVPDWGFTIAELVMDGQENENSSSADSAGLLRVFRAIRVVRLLRLAKLKRLVDDIKDHITSEKTFITFYIGELVFMVVFLNHFLGAIWYLVGEAGKSGKSDDNWIDYYDIQGKPLLYRYCTSFLWTISHFGLGSTLLMPTNTGERAFNILIFLVGMFLFAVITAAMSSSMVKMQNAEAEKSRQFWLLRLYLREHHVPQVLTVRLLRYLEFQEKHSSSHVDEKKLTILSALSETLRKELKSSVNYGPMLRGHPVFSHMMHEYHMLTASMADQAIQLRNLMEGETLFTRAAIAKEMLWMMSGMLMYSRKGNDDQRVRESDWLNEHCLWVSWVIRGDLKSVANSLVIVVDARLFRDAAQENLPATTFLLEYATVWAEWLSSHQAEELTDLIQHDEGMINISPFVTDAKERMWAKDPHLHKQGSVLTRLSTHGHGHFHMPKFGHKQSQSH
jgi:hypothetical protein